MAEQYTAGTVEEILLPHLDAAYNLALYAISGAMLGEKAAR